MNISSLVSGSNSSLLATYGNQAALDVVGEGAIEVAKPFIAFVAAPLLERVVQRAFSQIAAFLTEARSKASSLSTMAFQKFRPADALSCYENILVQYPTADENSLSIAQDVCNNNASQLVVYNLQLNSPGVQAIAAALEQNSVLRNLTFSNVYCDTTVFANAFVEALQVNFNLQHLNLDFGDINPGVFYPSPMTSLAARTIFEKLACFNLSSLDMGFIDLTTGAAQTLATTFQHNPYFPLAKLGISWHINNDPLTSQINLVFRGVNESRCLTGFQPATYTGLNADGLVSLFQAIGGNQTVSGLDLWCTSSYVLNDTQKQAILDAIMANLCFLSYTNTIPGYPCFDSDFVAAIQNITQGRTPCERDARCFSLPVDCSASRSDPPLPPKGSPSSETSFTKTKSFYAVVSSVAAAAVAVLTGWVGKRRGWWCSRSRVEEAEPGAGPADIQLPIQTIQSTNQLNTSLPSEPSQEGLAGES